MHSLNKISYAIICSMLVACGGGSSDSEVTVDEKTSIVVEFEGSALSSNSTKEIEIKGFKQIISSPTFGTVEEIGITSGLTLETEIEGEQNPEISRVSKLVYKFDLDKFTNPRNAHEDNNYGEYDSFIYEAEDGTKHEVKLKLVNDSFLTHQHYIRNVGQITGYDKLSSDDVIGYDINVLPLYKQGYSGKGVVVGVIDNELEFVHEDLKDNVLNEYSIAYDKYSDETSIHDTREYSVFHGTGVTGYIAAVGNNNKGIRGVAYNSKVVGFTDMNLTHSAKSILDIVEHNATYPNKKISVINHSMGGAYPIYSEGLISSSIYSTLKVKNIKFMQAIGNTFAQTSFAKSYSYAKNSYANFCLKYGLSCSTGQIESTSVNTDNIVVGALEPTGQKAYYSTAGSNIWVSTIGGASKKIGINNVNFGTLTTDQMGDKNGKSTRFVDCSNDFFGCNYVKDLVGTSMATPIASGVVALIEEATPNLSVYQVKYVLAKGAKYNDNMNYEAIEVKNFNEKSIVTPELGVITNSAGMKFSNFYGFGAIDAAKSVELAKNCANDEDCKNRKDYSALKTTTLAKQNCSMDSLRSKEHFYQYTCTFKQSEDVKSIEGVNFDLGTLVFDDDLDECASHPNFRNDYTNEVHGPFQLSITSPNGTKSILKPYYEFHIGSDTSKIPFLSNASYLESSSRGDVWKVNVISYCKLDTNKSFSENTMTVKGFNY
jgi:subtilisin family serine protease